jgi:hypothetical protein
MLTAILTTQVLTLLLQATFIDKALLFLTFIIVIFGILFYYVNTPIVILSAWHHTFESFEHSPEEIYVSVQQAIASKEVPGVSFRRITRFQEGILSNQREYLRIEYGSYMIDVCAAPFAKSFFVSWRMMEQKTFVRQMMRKYPALAGLADYKTFYEQDTEHMVKDYLHNGILEALGEMTTTKGIRALSESEKMLQRN